MDWAEVKLTISKKMCSVCAAVFQAGFHHSSTTNSWIFPIVDPTSHNGAPLQRPPVILPPFIMHNVLNRFANMMKTKFTKFVMEHQSKESLVRHLSSYTSDAAESVKSVSVAGSRDFQEKNRVDNVARGHIAAERD